MAPELTSAEAAIRLGVGPSRIRQLIATGELKSRKVGNTRLILVRDLERFERQPSTKPGPKPKRSRKA